MLCFLFMLFAIVNCGAQELLTTAEPEQYSINAVELPKSSASNAGSRIIGGSPASIENYPFIVQVQYFGSLLCGGTFVTRRHVLSAAHCFINQYVVLKPQYFTIRGGTTYLGAGGEVYNVSQIIVHESYNQTVQDNDIAVMVLSSEVSLNSSIDTAMLPIAGENLPDNTTVVVAGWGKTNVSETATASPVLNDVNVQTVNQETCVWRYLYLQMISGYPFPVTNAMLCAGLLDVGGADSCQGDSGGPLLYQGIVVGITSWGYSCAEPAFPGVYTRVSMFTTWINNTVNNIENQNSTVTPDGKGSSAHDAHLVGFTTLLIPILFVMLSV